MRKFPELVRVVPDLDLASGTLTLPFRTARSAASDLAATGELVTGHLSAGTDPGAWCPARWPRRCRASPANRYGWC